MGYSGLLRTTIITVTSFLLTFMPPWALYIQSQARPISVANVRPENQIVTYVEDFSSDVHKAYTDRAEWDIAAHQLRIALTSGGAHRESAIAPDGRGGAYIVWQDLRNNDSNGNWDIYGQHVDSRGNRLWNTDLRINSDTGGAFQGNPLVAVDRAGNAVVAWVDDREEPAAKAVYAQKISPQGNKLWPGDIRVNGPRSYRAGWGTDSFGMALDAADNLIVAWEGILDGDWSDRDVHAQKIAPTGERVWPEDVRINAQKEFGQWSIAVGADLQGNAFVVWIDNRHGGEDLYAQRLDANGNRQWLTDVKVSAGYARRKQGNPNVVVDTQGNAVIVWRNGPADPPLDEETSTIYAQKISPNGRLRWGTDRQVNADSTHVFRGHPRAALANQDAVMVIWEDTRRGFELGTVDIYGQLLDSNGLRQWADDLRITPENRRDWNLRPRIQIDGACAWISWQTDDDNINIQVLDVATKRGLLPALVRINDGDGKVDEVEPDIVALGTGKLLAIWHSVDRDNWDINALLFSPDGTQVWPKAIRVNDVDIKMKRQKARIATNLRDESLIVWHDEQGGVFGQLLDSLGNRLWHAERRLDANGRRSYYPDVAALHDGSFVVVWLEEREPNSNLWDVYAQRIGIDGSPWWSGGKRISMEENRPREVDARSAPVVVVDQQGYFIVLWRDMREGHANLLMQRFTSHGSATWPSAMAIDAELYTLSGRFHDRVFAATARSEITVALAGARQGRYGLLVQRYNLSGQPLWGAGTWVAGGTAPSYYGNPNVELLSDNSVVIVWDEEPAFRDAYAQRVGIQGELLWLNRVRLNRYKSWPLYPSLSGMVDDSFVAVWNDERYGDNNIYAQRFRTDGHILWPAELALTTAENFVYRYGVAESDTLDNETSPIMRVALIANHALADGRVTYYLTNNGGSTWEEAIPGTIHEFHGTGSDLRWRAVLTSHGTNSPIVERVILRYGPGLGQDAYEPDDICQLSGAVPYVSIDSNVLRRDFDHAGDVDWVAFDVEAGKTYIIQAANPQDRADLAMELRDACENAPLASDENAFGQEASIVWSAAASERLYARVKNYDPNVFGSNTGYDFSIRLLTRNPIAIIVAGHNDAYTLQNKINNAADMAYRVLLQSGVPKYNIRYFSLGPQRDVDGNGYKDDIFGPPDPQAVRNAIQQWVGSRATGTGTSFFLYLVDHGYYDRFYAAGTAGKITAADLDLWLSNLEATTGILNVNVIIEACRSGSFIDVTEFGPDEISRSNRVIITSTSSRLDAWPSDQGAYFSDAFWTAIRQGRDLRTAFERGREAVIASGHSQQPWLDDNGDAVADDRDGALASTRGLSGAFTGSPPIIDRAWLDPVTGVRAHLRAEVRDDFMVQRVWAEIYPPDFVEPPPSPDGSTPSLHPPTIELTHVDNDLYAASYAGFIKPGLYRIIFYAQDDDGNQALPHATTVMVSSENKTFYLPLIEISGLLR